MRQCTEPHTHATYPLCCACWEEGQHQGKGANEEPWQRIDDADLLKDLPGVMEGGQEADMPVADLCGVVYKQVWEAIREAPAAQ